MERCLHDNTQRLEDFDTPEGVVDEFCLHCGLIWSRPDEEGIWAKYDLRTPVRARKLDEPRSLDSGRTVPAGDYVCADLSGRIFHMPADLFELLYARREG